MFRDLIHQLLLTSPEPQIYHLGQNRDLTPAAHYSYA